MPTFTLGQAAYVNKGAYSASASYAALNTVTYNGGTWVALQNVSGVEPGSDSSKWLCITQGIRSLTFAAGATGYMTVTLVLTDGTTSTANVPVGAIGDGTITVDKLASSFVLPANQGGTGRTDGAQKPIQAFTTGVLTASGWNSTTKKQTLTVTGMAATSQFIAQPNNKAGWIAALDATLYPPTAVTNGLEFECDTIPAADIPVTVYWW